MSWGFGGMNGLQEGGILWEASVKIEAIGGDLLNVRYRSRSVEANDKLLDTC